MLLVLKSLIASSTGHDMGGMQCIDCGAPCMQGAGFSWLVPLTDGVPPVGWPHALAYLSLPVMLVASQFLSQKIISPPPSADPQQQQSQAILKFLPFMIGAPCLCRTANATSPY